VGVRLARTRSGAAKIAEEAREVWEARDEGAERVEEEVGDLLFVAANLARHLGVDPEAALRRACGKFARGASRRWRTSCRGGGKRPADSTLEEMDAIWDAVRAADRERQAGAG
jgi:ATP diphosphatase